MPNAALSITINGRPITAITKRRLMLLRTAADLTLFGSGLFVAWTASRVARDTVTTAATDAGVGNTSAFCAGIVASSAACAVTNLLFSDKAAVADRVMDSTALIGDIIGTVVGGTIGGLGGLASAAAQGRFPDFNTIDNACSNGNDIGADVGATVGTACGAAIVIAGSGAIARMALNK